MALTKEQILAADDLALHEVEVPEWGGTVLVRTMTGLERDKFETDQYVRDVGTDDVRARLCAICICDESRNRLFSDDEVEALGAKSAKALERVFEVVKTINGFSAGDIDELEGN